LFVVKPRPADEPNGIHAAGAATGDGAAASETAIVRRRNSKREDTMPEVVVYALGGRTQDQKRGLMKDITDAVTKNFGVKPEQVVVTLVESQKQDKMKGGVLFSEMAPR
jgi:4-oxalocrotonate tautomerase